MKHASIRPRPTRRASKISTPTRWLFFAGVCGLAAQALGAGSSERRELPVFDGDSPSFALSFGDFDGDGLLDVFVAGGSQPDRLLRNLGDGRFGDVTEAMGLGETSGSLAALWQDVDGDQDLDLFAIGSNGAPRLLENCGSACFNDASAALSGPAGRVLAARWMDVDGDGYADLDLSTSGGEVLLLNRGGLHFERADLPAVEARTTGTPIDPTSDRLAVSPPPGPSIGGIGSAGSGSSTAASGICAGSITDQATSLCIDASSAPTLGQLYPLSADFNVSASGNVGIGTTVPGQKLDVVGAVRASGQLISTLTGTAPLSVSSTVKVASFNADLLDGLDSAAFTQLGPTIEGIEITNGTIANADIASGAAIAGTKITADFGSQSIQSTGAFSVLGMRTAATAFSPNVLGGFSGNSVSAGVGGATIAGGGFSFTENLVTDHFGTVGGGEDNRAGDNTGSAIDAMWATVAGGTGNSAGGQGSTVGGGTGNSATSGLTTVCGGQFNIADASGATIGGGEFNSALASSTTIGGGKENIAQGQFATVPGGQLNTAQGQWSLAAGRQAKANHHGAFVWSDSNNLGTGVDFASTDLDQFLIRAAGGVGIGTNLPESPVHGFAGSAGNVIASAAASLTLESNGPNILQLLAPDGQLRGIFFGDPTHFASGSIQYDSGNVNSMEFGTNGTTKMVIQSTGQIGIGTLSPEAPLHVFEGSAGTVTANGSSTLVLERNASTYVSLLTPDASESGILFGAPINAADGGIVYNNGATPRGLQFRTAGNVSRMIIDSTGNVGIGTTAPSFLLHVNGSAGKPGGGAWSVASDARLKKDVRPLDGALERLLKLRGVTYEYVDPEAIGELDGERMGLIAQEVEEVFPDWVETGPDGFKKLTVRGFEALAVEALRELADQNRLLERDLAEVRAALEQQRTQHDALVDRMERIEASFAR